MVDFLERFVTLTLLSAVVYLPVMADAPELLLDMLDMIKGCGCRSRPRPHSMSWYGKRTREMGLTTPYHRQHVPIDREPPAMWQFAM